ncbi:isochorismatase family protein [Streptococcus dentiloxodontae]
MTADYLLVIDMQTDYVGEKKGYPASLLAAVNAKIASYPAERVLYVVNRFFWELNSKPKTFAQGLSVVSDYIFEKRRASCLTNPTLKDFLKNSGAKSLEFIGVDGNGCVNGSVLAAVREGYQVSADLAAIGVLNKKKFQRTLQHWDVCQVEMKSELDG